jgi:hypothetical protein
VAAPAFDDAESLVNFPYQKKPRIRRDLGSGGINENGSVEIRSYWLFLSFTIPEHRLTSGIFNQKNSSQLCCGVKNEEGVSLEGETTCPLPIQNGF